MPVVRLELDRFSEIVGAKRERILDRLPYVGLDIESVERDSVSVEYSPNRPDFGTDYGIAKALRGVMGIEVGLPSYPTSQSGIEVSVDQRLSTVRPYIACATAEVSHLDDEDVRQLISLQEDLHNGVGRRRRKAAIGLHDLKAVRPPIRYIAKSASFRFTPLDYGEMSLKEVLLDTETGRLFASALPNTRTYPILADSRDVVLSFPPITNGEATRVSTRTGRIFIDVTSTEKGVGEDVLAIISTTLADMGAKLGSVAIKYQKGRTITPNLAPRRVRLDEDLITKVTGLDLERKRMLDCLRRTRLGLSGKQVLVPRYRIDILHPVDIAEEVALGYGIDRIEPEYPASKQPGVFNPKEQFLDRVADVMSGGGMIESMTYELTDAKSVYDNFGRDSRSRIGVENPRSIDHSLLRDSLIPSLMSVLSKNTKEEYPQRIFEVGRVYLGAKNHVNESWHLASLVAHAGSSFSEAKMRLEAFTRVMLGFSLSTRPSSHWAFVEGRTASVSAGAAIIGHMGEVRPEVLVSFGVNVPVAGFEIDLNIAGKHLK